MNQRTVIGVAITICGLLIIAFSPVASGQAVALVASPLVDHPVLSSVGHRTPHAWRSGLGAWGENFAEETLRLRGYDEIHTIKMAGNQGIDRISVRRAADGHIADVRFVEVKSGRSDKLLLANTKYSGRQMSRKWLADRLRAAYRSKDSQLRNLALEIRQFAKDTGRPLESLGEIIQNNTRTGVLRRFAADGKTELSSQSIETLLSQIQRKAVASNTKSWAARSLAEFDQINSTRMMPWVHAASSESSALASIGRNTRATAVAFRHGTQHKANGKLIGRLLPRSAGRVAVVAALAADAAGLVNTEYAYRAGTISRRDRDVRHLTSLGGMGGAWAGATALSATGATIGLAGGPFVWITVPAGAVVGGAIGGVGGYFAGSTVAGFAASAWYDSVDARIRDRVELELIARPFSR